MKNNLRRAWFGAALALAPGIALAQNYNLQVRTSPPALVPNTNSPSLYLSPFGTQWESLVDPNSGIPCSASTPWCVSSGGGGSSSPYSYTPVTGSQNALAITSATALTIPASAVYATVQAQGGTVNYSLVSDLTPTGTSGLQLFSGQYLTIQGPALLAAAKFIDATGSSATITVEYLK